MGIETRGIPGVNNGEDFFSAETILGDPAILTILNKYTGGSGKDAIPEKDAILEEIVSQLNNHPESQESFIIDLFDDLAREGEGEEEWVQTNRRDGACEILTSQAMEPIIKGNSTVVSYAYLEAISLQDRKNDPFSGSIDTLLEVGKAIAPYFPVDSGLKKKIIKAWNGVINEFLWQDEKSYMQLKLEEIEYIMSPTWILDDQVKQLVLERGNISNVQIAKELGVSPSTIGSLLKRLVATGEIESREHRRSKQDKQIAELIKKGFSSPQIAKQLDIPLSEVKSSRQRSIKAGEIESKKRSTPQVLFERDKQVAELIRRGLKNREIAEELDILPFEVSDSIRRLTKAGEIESRKGGRPPDVIKREGESNSSQD